MASPRSRFKNWLRRPGNKKKLLGLYRRQRGNCFYCNTHVPYIQEQHVTYEEHGNHATFDHEIPLSKGGRIGISNLVMACWECNQKRNQEDIDYKNYLRKKDMALDPTLRMEQHSKINKEANWTKLLEELRGTEREGIEDFIKYITERTDFKTAPASTKYHMNYPGGLAEHTLNVLRFTREVQEKLQVPDIDPHSLTLAALLHDLCKVNYYIVEEVFDKEYKNETNRWRKMEVWGVDDLIPLGHGEKSVIIASRYIKLNLEEMAAIRWHMAWSDQGVHSYYPSGAPFKTSLDKYPLLKLLMLGDEMAELYESFAYEG